MHQFERRRMYRIAAKITQEILVFLEYVHIDARSREQIPQHHASGTAPGNTATSMNCIGHPK
jgi:hypothetical protein